MQRPRLSYANVTSSLALFIALGGTGYAVTKLPRNSVGTTQLKANAVTSAKIRAGAVQRSDLAPSVRPGSGSGGTRGPRGPAGPAGAKGDPGPSEVIQADRPAVVAIPEGPGGEAQLVSLTLAPGSWMLDADTALIENTAAPLSEYFECRLQTAAGAVLGKMALRIGSSAGSVFGGPLPVHVAASFAVPTQVTYICRHDDDVTGTGVVASRTTFQATRVGSLENR
jgi:hypothetical protein